jgi:hypothetical protein
MNPRKWVWTFCATFVLIAAAWGYAQAVQNQPPTIISGSDLGFRIEGRRGNTPIGTLVVRINGQWVEAESIPGLKPVNSK